MTYTYSPVKVAASTKGLWATVMTIGQDQWYDDDEDDENDDGFWWCGGVMIKLT